MFRGDKYVTPLYRLLEGDVPDQGATGIWMSVGDARLLVTAAHAIDDGFIWFPMERGFKRLGSPGVITTPPAGGRIADKGDLAVFHLTAEDQKSRHPFHEYVDITMVDVNLNYRFRDFYEYTGYPYRKARLDRARKETTPIYMSVTSETVPEEKFKKLGLSILAHTVIAYQKKTMLMDGKPYNPPMPHGVSGGAVWKRYPGSEDRKLAAVAIEFQKDRLVGTSICAVTEYLRARLPHLSPLIPRPTALEVVVTKGGAPVEPVTPKSAA